MVSRSTPIENGVPANRPVSQDSVPRSVNVIVVGSNFENVLLTSTV